MTSRLVLMAYLLSILRNSTVCDRLLLAGCRPTVTSAYDPKRTSTSAQLSVSFDGFECG